MRQPRPAAVPTYTVVVKLTGMQTFTRNNVPVTLNSVARVDAALGAGQLQETVTVSADTPLLQTDRAEVRQELRARELQDLPVPIGRNYQELFVTLPGFTPPADAHSIPSNPSRALTFNVNGASNQGNNTRIDGVSSTNVWLPHVVAYVPALESIETINVVTNNFDAEQGHLPVLAGTLVADEVEQLVPLERAVVPVVLKSPFRIASVGTEIVLGTITSRR